MVFTLYGRVETRNLFNLHIAGYNRVTINLSYYR